jgi:hypothetical protein
MSRNSVAHHAVECTQDDKIELWMIDDGALGKACNDNSKLIPKISQIFLRVQNLR